MEALSFTVNMIIALWTASQCDVQLALVLILHTGIFRSSRVLKTLDHCDDHSYISERKLRPTTCLVQLPRIPATERPVRNAVVSQISTMRPCCINARAIMMI